MKEFVEKYGSPLYVYDASLVRKRGEELKRHFKGADLHYAVKANGNPAILKIIKGLGFGVEAVSPGELTLAKSCGFPKSRISFTCASLTEKELVQASKVAGRVHLDSLRQLEMWGRLKLGRDVSLRLNQGIGGGHHHHVITGGEDSKFGITLSDLPEALRIAERHNLRVVSLQQHIGSNVLDAALFVKGMRTLLTTAANIPGITHVDFGGGFGVPYRAGEKRLNLKLLGAEWRRVAKGLAYTYAFEPGRYLVAEAGTLLAEVVDRKETKKHRFVGVNAGMNQLMRPALYEAFHPIENLSRKGKKEKVSIVGNICESSDIFAKGREIVSPQVGDILAIGLAGAYGASMASTYNLRPVPKEVLIDGNKVRDISYSRDPFLAQYR